MVHLTMCNKRLDVHRYVDYFRGHVAFGYTPNQGKTENVHAQSR